MLLGTLLKIDISLTTPPLVVGQGRKKVHVFDNLIELQFLHEIIILFRKIGPPMKHNCAY